MTVRELIELLTVADPDAVVLYLDMYADPEESDEIREVVIPRLEWTFEQGRDGGIEYEMRYPGLPRSPDDEFTDLVQRACKVVVLASGPTNLRFVKDEIL